MNKIGLYGNNSFRLNLILSYEIDTTTLDKVFETFLQFTLPNH